MTRRELLEKRYNLRLQALAKGAKHEVGKTYFCGYWQRTYKVLDLTTNTGDWRGWSVTCRWQDGQITEHCTSLDPYRDFLVEVSV